MTEAVIQTCSLFELVRLKCSGSADMSLYPHISTEPMDWDSSDVTGEPVTTADSFVESISGDESEESTYSSFSDTDESPYLTEDSDEETDESPNLIEDCYDNIITDNPFEDLESQNFLDAEFKDINDRLDAELLDLDTQNLLDVEIQDLESQNFLDAEFRDLNDRLDSELQDLHVMRDSLNEIGDAVDKKIQETHAMVLGDDIEEEPDSEFLALFLADYTKDELEDSEESDTEEEYELSHSELHALLLADYTAEELEESDSEMQVSVHVEFTEEQQLHWTAEEKLVHSLVLAELEESEEAMSGYGIYQADSDAGIPLEINGLGPQQSSLHKILDWLVNME